MIDQKRNQDIFKFITEDIPLGTPKIQRDHDPFWQRLTARGTEIWLDTGDIQAAGELWVRDFSALTTNNTLLNKEVQKGIYDDLIVKANHLLRDWDKNERIKEIAFILNARHALWLVQNFGGKVSVELHTDLAHDIEQTVEYAERFYAICPDHFIIKVPLTPAGYIATRKIREKGIPVNFTLNFSARHNLIASIFSKPTYVNVFLGRTNAYVANNGLGDGQMIGEKTTLASQRVVRDASANNEEPTKQIAASMRDPIQTAYLAGVDVFTMPIPVAQGAKKSHSGNWTSRRDRDYMVTLNQDIDPSEIHIEKLWNYTEQEHAFAKDLDANPPESTQDFIKRAHDAGLEDLFPSVSEEEMQKIYEDGKIPDHHHWHEKVKNNQLAIDSLLNLAAIGAFTKDQQALDQRIEQLISSV